VKTPCPRPAAGVSGMGATLGPAESTKAGFTLSRVRWLVVWRKGKLGIVKGVVMPVCSIQTSPYPERITVLSFSRYDNPKRGPKSCQCSSRALRENPSLPR
jgi:hypothetical protein